MTAPQQADTRPVIVDALGARNGGTAYAAIQTSLRLGSEVIVAAGDGSLVARGLSGSRARVHRVNRRWALPIPARVAWQAGVLPQLAVQHRARAVITWSGMLPRDPGAPVVCLLANPVMFMSNGLANRVRRAAVRRTARRAAAVVVPSDGMRALVERMTRSPVTVVPLGVDSNRFSPGPGPPGDAILYVADFYRHKRHELVLAAWAQLPAPRPPLRFVGSAAVDRSAFRTFLKRVEQHRGLGHIEVLQHLPLGQLVEVYRAARVMMVPSTAESFCMPVLEAKACGVPVVVRDLPTLREAGGSSASYVAGDDPARWAAAISRFLEDDEAHAEAAKSGRAHAMTLSWEATAAAMRSLLSSAATRA